MSLLYSPTSGDNQQDVENIQRIEKAKVFNTYLKAL